MENKKKPKKKDEGTMQIKVGTRVRYGQTTGVVETLVDATENAPVAVAVIRVDNKPDVTVSVTVDNLEIIEG